MADPHGADGGLTSRMGAVTRRRKRFWRPTLPAVDRSAATPVTEAVGAPASIRAFSYLTIDEIADGIVTVLVSDWPELDQRGRLTFHDTTAAVAIAVNQTRLELLLRRSRVPRGIANRALRETDAFAALTIGPLGLDPAVRRDHPEQWIIPPIYDITADARDAAKASFFSAVGRPLTPQAERRLPAKPRHSQDQPD
jgi:hypothetical protein